MAADSPHMGRRGGAPVIYRQVPVLLKPPKRTPAHALPSALHISISSSLSVLVFGVINAAVTKSLGATNKWSKLVQSGTLIAMVTCTILAMPNLGNSVIKAVQRIAGVMIGGWVFFGLYAGCQAWWFLAVCLGVWAFLLVAASFWLTGKQFLFPVALVTAFVVATNFSTVQQAFTMTLVKTIAISGAIVVYTTASILLFPQTATQQVINALSDALADLHKLAEMVLVSGPGAEEAAAAAEPGAQSAELTAADAADAKAAGKKAKKAAAPAPSKAAVLSARVSFQLQAVQQLLPATRKERYMGTIGRYMCFLPSVRPTGLDETAALATVFNMSQVARTLINMMLEFGAVPMAVRPPPSQMVAPPADQLVAPLSQHAVATLQDLAQALPRGRLPCDSVPCANLSAYGDTLRQLIACTVGGALDAQQAPKAAAAAPAAAGGVAGKWQRAAAAAAGIKLGGAQGQALSAQQIAAVFGQLLSDAVTSEDAQVSTWCSMLVLNRQLGKALTGLAGSMNVLLPQLPGAKRAA